MLALITGGAGFIGSNLADRLLEEGNEVRIWDDLSTGKMENVPKGIIFHRLDISKNIFTHKKYDVIFHLAAKARIQPSFDEPLLTHDTNVTGMIKVLEIARQTGAKVIYPGSSSVYHDIYANPYSFTKFQAEEYCKLYNKVYNVPVGIARFFNVYGPRQLESGPYSTVIGIFEKQKREGIPLTVTGTGEKRRDFTHVDDIVSGLIAIAKHGDLKGEIYNLGCGKNYSINELAQMFHPDRVEHLPDRPGEAETTLADITFSKEKLGWEPKIQLNDYVEEILCGL
jgi:UDP-glucose 4-epimerase